MKKSILSIVMAFAMFFQATAHAYTASNEVTNETIRDVIAYVVENPSSYSSEIVAAAERLQTQDIELSQEKLNQINALVLQQTEVANAEYNNFVLTNTIAVIAVIAAITLAVSL